jgi:hypothetical protein
MYCLYMSTGAQPKRCQNQKSAGVATTETTPLSPGDHKAGMTSAAAEFGGKPNA